MGKIFFWHKKHWPLLQKTDQLNIIKIKNSSKNN